MTTKHLFLTLWSLLWLSFSHASMSAPVSDPRISLSAKPSANGRPTQFCLKCEQAPTQAVLMALFQKAHVHFLLDQPMTGTVTVDLEDLSFSTTLHAVCNAANPTLTCALLGDIYRVTAVPSCVPFYPTPYIPPMYRPLRTEADIKVAQRQPGWTERIMPLPDVRPSIAASWPNISWGYQEPSGLQMGLWKPGNSGAMLCVIRNAGSKPVRYDGHFVGYWEMIRIWARPHGTLPWTEVPFLLRGLVGATGVGPRPEDYHDLMPGQSLLREQMTFPLQFLLPLWYVDSLNSTFIIPLNEYDWPTGSQTLDIKVSQMWLHDDPEASLDSGVITFPMETVNAK